MSAYLWTFATFAGFVWCMGRALMAWLEDRPTDQVNMESETT